MNTVTSAGFDSPIIMLRMRFGVLVFWLTLLAGPLTLLGCEAGARTDSYVSPVIDTTLCEMLACPETFDRRTVRFKAHFESDGIENVGLVDPACRHQGGAEPRETLVLSSGDRAAFNRAIYSGTQGTIDREIEATFTGVFLAHPAPFPLFIYNPAHAVNLTHITDVRVRAHPRPAA